MGAPSPVHLAVLTAWANSAPLGLWLQRLGVALGLLKAVKRQTTWPGTWLYPHAHHEQEQIQSSAYLLYEKTTVI